MSPLDRLIAGQVRAQRGPLWLAAACAASVAFGAVALLGLSGWFLAGAAVAGAAGTVAVQAFNFLLPSAAIRFLAILRTGARYGERVFSHEAALRGLASIRGALFGALLVGPPDRVLALSSGEAAARLVQDVDAVETQFVRRSAPYALAFSALTAAGLAALANPWAALVAPAGLGLQLLLSDLIAKRLSHQAGADSLKAAGQLKDGFTALAAAAGELRCYGMVEPALARMAGVDSDLGAARGRIWFGEGALGMAPAVATGLAVAATLALTARSGLALSALSALACAAAMEGAAGLARAFQHRGALEAASVRLNGMLTDNPHPEGEGNHAEHGGGGLSLDPGVRIERDVSAETRWKEVDVAANPLHHPEPVLGRALRATRGGGPPPPPVEDLALSGPSGWLSLQPGEVLAVTGPSGAGKTRLLTALLGLRSAPAGLARIGGRPLEDLPTGAARALFAWAPQDAAVIAATVADNLRLGDPKADEAAMWAALTDADLASRVRAMPLGLETWIGDGGQTLSGGERKRLSLARALLRPAPWLLLDEPTEGLDSATEALVVERLKARLARTRQGALIVSHRPAPLALATRRLTVG